MSIGKDSNPSLNKKSHSVAMVYTSVNKSNKLFSIPGLKEVTQHPNWFLSDHIFSYLNVL